jgi:predicted nucleic acid-binding protein
LASKIFLDTSVVNKVVEFGEYIFENYLSDDKVAAYKRRPLEDQHDIDALRRLFQGWHQMSMPLYISETTLAELNNTFDPSKRDRLMQYAWEVFEHWRAYGSEIARNEFESPEFSRTVRRISRALIEVKGSVDRELLAEACSLSCDVFLTMDRRSLWNHRHRIPLTTVRILRPVELCAELGF